METYHGHNFGDVFNVVLHWNFLVAGLWHCPNGFTNDSSQHVKFSSRANHSDNSGTQTKTRNNSKITLRATLRFQHAFDLKNPILAPAPFLSTGFQWDTNMFVPSLQ
jgi:hypothetical protein